MRLIDAEDIKDYWVESEGSKEEFIKENMPDDADYTEYSEFFDKMLQAFKNVVDTSPAIEAEPVVHAHWTKLDIRELRKQFDKFGINVSYRICCSNCGSYNDVCTAFCPDCGAKMDEEQ